VLHTAAILLKPGGLLVIEHADVQGADAGLLGVAGLAQSLVAGDELALLAKMSIGTRVWPEVIDRKDLNGLPRFTIARRSS
jgi:hypothetical protein